MKLLAQRQPNNDTRPLHSPPAQAAFEPSIRSLQLRLVSFGGGEGLFFGQALGVLGSADSLQQCLHIFLLRCVPAVV